MSDRLSTGWALALLVLGVAAVILLGRRLSGAEAPKRQALPSPATDDNEEDEEAEPICRARGPSGAVDRSVEAQARCVAGTLAHGRRVCGSWGASLRRYRYGLADHGCPLADPRAYVRRVSAYGRALGLPPL